MIVFTKRGQVSYPINASGSHIPLFRKKRSRSGKVANNFLIWEGIGFWGKDYFRYAHSKYFLARSIDTAIDWSSLTNQKYYIFITLAG